MNPDEETKARDIFSRPANAWTNDEKNFLEGLFKRNLRGQLKKIRDEVQT